MQGYKGKISETHQLLVPQAVIYQVVRKLVKRLHGTASQVGRKIQTSKRHLLQLLSKRLLIALTGLPETQWDFMYLPAEDNVFHIHVMLVHHVNQNLL